MKVIKNSEKKEIKNLQKKLDKKVKAIEENEAKLKEKTPLDCLDFFIPAPLYTILPTEWRDLIDQSSKHFPVL